MVLDEPFGNHVFVRFPLALSMGWNWWCTTDEYGKTGGMSLWDHDTKRLLLPCWAPFLILSLIHSKASQLPWCEQPWNFKSSCGKARSWDSASGRPWRTEAYKSVWGSLEAELSDHVSSWEDCSSHPQLESLCWRSEPEAPSWAALAFLTHRNLDK